MSRRAFFQEAPAAGVTAVVAAATNVQIVEPDKIYVIMCKDWEYNDEFLYTTEGYHTTRYAFYDKEKADKLCADLNAEWLAEIDPQDYDQSHVLDGTESREEAFDKMAGDDYGYDLRECPNYSVVELAPQKTQPKPNEQSSGSR